MKIYTKTGDDGSTGLFGGGRVLKSDPRIECYGTVDELNAALGLAGAVPESAELVKALHAVQCDLFAIGSHLATPEDNRNRSALPPLDEGLPARLESEIDTAEAQLSPLRQFILPGGTETAARLHLARTICRRAERLLVDFAASQPVAPVILVYVNRLSDWLFVQARMANHRAGVGDVPWVAAGSTKSTVKPSDR